MPNLVWYVSILEKQAGIYIANYGVESMYLAFGVGAALMGDGEVQFDAIVINMMSRALSEFYGSHVFINMVPSLLFHSF